MSSILSLYFLCFLVWRLRCSQREETADDSKLESVCPHNWKIMIGFSMVHGKAILFDLFPINNWAFHFSLNHFLAPKLDVWIKVGEIVAYALCKTIRVKRNCNVISARYSPRNLMLRRLAFGKSHIKIDSFVASPKKNPRIFTSG